MTARELIRLRPVRGLQIFCDRNPRPVGGTWAEMVRKHEFYSLRLNHRKVYHRKFDLLSESGSLMWQKSLSNVLDLDSFIAILSNMNLVSDFVR